MITNRNMSSPAYDRRGAKELTLKDAHMALPREVQAFIPEENLSYYEKTNEMHCGKGPEGGSKFNGVGNIFEVVGRYTDLAQKVAERKDDRSALILEGAPESAFLPAVREAGMSETLPEALYFKVDGVDGTLGIEKMGNLAPDTKIRIVREKGSANLDAKDYSPASFIAILSNGAEMPKTNFATVIVGRDPSPGAKDEIWTVHPGAPIRPTLREAEFTRALRGPSDTQPGEPRDEIVMTLAELMEKTDLTKEDYVKVTIE